MKKWLFIFFVSGVLCGAAGCAQGPWPVKKTPKKKVSPLAQRASLQNRILLLEAERLKLERELSGGSLRSPLTALTEAAPGSNINDLLLRSEINRIDNQLHELRGQLSFDETSAELQ